MRTMLQIQALYTPVSQHVRTAGGKLGRGGDEQDTETKDGRYPDFPLQAHLELKYHVYHNR